MIIRHNLPIRNFTKIHRSVFTNPELTDGAVRLYSYLCSLRNGADFSDKYIIKAMGISQNVLSRRKKELKEHGLILMDQVSPRIYIIYIGYPGQPASVVKSTWLSDHDDNI